MNDAIAYLLMCVGKIILEKIKAMFRKIYCKNVFAIVFSVAECVHCKLRNCKVHKRNNKGKFNVMN